MLRISPTNDISLIKPLYREIFGGVFDGDIAFILYDGTLEKGEKPVGLAHIKIVEDTVKIKKIGILEKMRNKGMGDFFTRSLLFHYIGAARYIEIEYQDEYFAQFGFKKTEKNTMKIESEKLNFPCNCH